MSVDVAVPHVAVDGQTGGRGWPAARVAALPLKTLRLTTIFPAVKPLKVWAEAGTARNASRDIRIVVRDMGTCSREGCCECNAAGRLRVYNPVVSK